MRWLPIGRRKWLDELERLGKASPESVLGVPIGADAEELKAAYRAKVRTYHPDKADSFMRRYNEEVMKIVNIAYASLCGRSK